MASIQLYACHFAGQSLAEGIISNIGLDSPEVDMPILIGKDMPLLWPGLEVHAPEVPHKSLGDETAHGTVLLGQTQLS